MTFELGRSRCGAVMRGEAVDRDGERVGDFSHPRAVPHKYSADDTPCGLCGSFDLDAGTRCDCDCHEARRFIDGVRLRDAAS